MKASVEMSTCHHNRFNMALLFNDTKYICNSISLIYNVRVSVLVSDFPKTFQAFEVF